MFHHAMHNLFLRQALALGLGLFLLATQVACGGGGGGSSDSEPPDSSSEEEGDDEGGCSVDMEEGPFDEVWPGDTWDSSDPDLQGMCPDQIDDAIDYAFASGNSTGAVLVVRNGYLIAEEYSDTRDEDSQVTSWSVAKSVTSALIGRALDQGYIENLEQSVADFIPDWQDSDKEDITVDYLLTLRTALEVLDADELYAADDQLQMSVDRELIGTPGDVLYTYSNADPMLAGEVIEDATGLNAQDYLDDKIGPETGFTGEWWEDTEGHILTYCCLDATPRSFARFGLLYARDGEWDGLQLLSEEWMDTSLETALDGDYGYYWWPIENDGFAALGLHDQLIAIYPDDDLVVLRFSNYTRLGDGSTVRTGLNLHLTFGPSDFETDEFLDMVYEALDP